MAQPAQQCGEPIVARLLDRRRPVEPSDLLALRRRWRRVGVATIEHVPQVEVDVTPPTGMDVDVGEMWHAVGTHVGERHVESGLLVRFAARRVPRCLARIDVPPWLQPDAEPLVTQQHDPTPTDDDSRAGDVHRVGVLVERIGEPFELAPDARDARALRVVDRFTFGDRPSHLVTQLVNIGHGANHMKIEHSS